MTSASISPQVYTNVLSHMLLFSLILLWKSSPLPWPTLEALLNVNFYKGPGPQSLCWLAATAFTKLTQIPKIAHSAVLHPVLRGTRSQVLWPGIRTLCQSTVV